MSAANTHLKKWLLAFTALTLAACSSAPVAERLAFTDSVIRDYQLSDQHKQRLQYYTSQKITLARAASSSLRGIDDGRLVERGNTSVAAVEIPADAPGVVVGSGPNWLAVSFERGSYLYFVSSQNEVNSPYWRDRRDGERYYLYAPDWDGRAGTVKLGNVPYQAVDHSIDSYLVVDREALYGSESRASTLSGRWLDGIKHP